jgi:hypothetical protein
MAAEFYFTPELHLKDGRIIRDLEDAASFGREEEVQPGAGLPEGPNISLECRGAKLGWEEAVS